MDLREHEFYVYTVSHSAMRAVIHTEAPWKGLKDSTFEFSKTKCLQLMKTKSSSIMGDRQKNKQSHWHHGGFIIFKQSLTARAAGGRKPAIYHNNNGFDSFFFSSAQD